VCEVGDVRNLPVVTTIVTEKSEDAIKIKCPLMYLPVFFKNQHMKQYEDFNPSG